jgi:hypothetical protein
MRTAKGDTAAPRFPRKRLMSAWDHRHPRTSAGIRLTAGGFQLSLGLVVLSFALKAETDQERRKFSWLSAGFLLMAALNLVGGWTSLAATRDDG